eukprot:IDg10428t1
MTETSSPLHHIMIAFLNPWSEMSGLDCCHYCIAGEFALPITSLAWHGDVQSSTKLREMSDALESRATVLAADATPGPQHTTPILPPNVVEHLTATNGSDEPVLSLSEVVSNEHFQISRIKGYDAPIGSISKLFFEGKHDLA